jgi:uncharacterized peroxidase-related enzyme
MVHIKINEELPGIRGLMDFRPETAAPLNALAEVLLRNEEGLTMGERELIAAYVSSLNDCTFCQNIHGAVAAYYLSNETVVKVKEKFEHSDISNKMKALLQIATNIQLGGKYVTENDITNAKNEGASDIEIHDTVLISAAFCMFNRYVDGLGTHAPDDPEMYRFRAKKIVEETGYTHSSPK